MHQLFPIRVGMLACYVDPWPPSDALFVYVLVMVWLLRPYPRNTLRDIFVSASPKPTGRQGPSVVHIHSTHGEALSAELFTRVGVSYICTVELWSIPWLFILFYLLDMSLLAGTTQDW